MRPDESHYFRISFNAPVDECKKILAEYYYLARQPELSDEQALQMEKILDMAAFDANMSFLINEIDEITFQDLDFYGEGYHSHFDDEVSIAQEYIMSENERQVLMCFSAAGQCVQAKGPIASSHYPRVERLYDATQSVRESLDRNFLKEHVPESSANSSIVSRHSHSEQKSPVLSVRRFFYDVFVEESVSWLTIGALVWLVWVVALL